MKKYCLLKSVLDYLHQTVYTQELERCGILFVAYTKDGIDYLEYEPSKEQIGVKVDGRQRCDSDDYYHIVHTHPKSEYSYPSIEDIWRLVTEPAIKLSVIATTWGIYTLKQKEKFKDHDWLNDLKAHKEGYEEEFKKDLQKYIDNMGILQDRKRARSINEHLLTPVECQDVKLFLTNISNRLDIEIKVYPWQYIQLHVVAS